MNKSCDTCIHKDKNIKESKYVKHNIYCDKRKCKIPSSDEAEWCDYWKESKEASQI